MVYYLPRSIKIISNSNNARFPIFHLSIYLAQILLDTHNISALSYNSNLRATTYKCITFGNKILIYLTMSESYFVLLLLYVAYKKVFILSECKMKRRMFIWLLLWPNRKVNLRRQSIYSISHSIAKLFITQTTRN